jgi:hypothetical protein
MLMFPGAQRVLCGNAVHDHVTSTPNPCTAEIGGLFTGYSSIRVNCLFFKGIPRKVGLRAPMTISQETALECKTGDPPFHKLVLQQR